MTYCIQYPKIQKMEKMMDKLIVTEKIHGANLGIGFINNALHIQSRRKLLHRNSTFMGLNNIVDELVAFIEKIKNIVQYDFLVYGEIFGNEVMRVMEYYDPESPFSNKSVFFRGFELYKREEDAYLKYSDAIEIFKQVGLPYLPKLCIKFESVKELYMKTETTKSAFSEKPVEGFVLKKDEEEYRVTKTIFKVKRKIFNEKHGFDIKTKKYINANRLMSAYTKCGDNLKEIEKEMIQDILKDAMKNVIHHVSEEVHKYFESCLDDNINDKFGIQAYIIRVFEKMKESMIQNVLQEMEVALRIELESKISLFLEKHYKRIVNFHTRKGVSVGGSNF